MRTVTAVACVLVAIGASSALAQTTPTATEPKANEPRNVEFGATVAAPTASAASPGEHKMYRPVDIQWNPAPSVLPKGSELAILYGDPGKQGVFAMRVRFPGGSYIAPHTHPTNELVTVLSGTFKLGTGINPDKSKVDVLPAGSFFGFAPGSVHYAYVDEPTEVQISTMGPWGINFVNPQDDPRRSQ